MGERASCLFVCTEPNYFATNPKYDDCNADWTLKILGIGPAKSEGPVKLCHAINPLGDYGTELMNAVCARFLGSPLNECLFDFPLHVESFVLT